MEGKCTLTGWIMLVLTVTLLLYEPVRDAEQSVPSSLALMMDYIKDSKAAIQGEEI